eukprot:2238040-Pyramimonas_sp.AAC.1
MFESPLCHSHPVDRSAQESDEGEETIGEPESPKSEGHEALVHGREGLAEVQGVQERDVQGPMGGDRGRPGRSVELDDVLTEVAARDEPALARGDKVQSRASCTIHRRRDELDITIPKTEDTNFVWGPLA